MPRRIWQWNFQKEAPFIPTRCSIKSTCICPWVYELPWIDTCALKELYSGWLLWFSADRCTSALSPVRPHPSGSSTAEVMVDIAVTRQVCRCARVCSAGYDHQLTLCMGLPVPGPPLGDNSDTLCNTTISFLNMFNYFCLHNWKRTSQVLKYHFHSNASASVEKIISWFWGNH